MLTRLSDQQLMEHLTGLGAWTATRAGELHHFLEQLSRSDGDPVREARLRYALSVYVEAVADMARRCQEARVEVERRAALATAGSHSTARPGAAG